MEFESREELIRFHWKHWGRGWNTNKSPTLKVLVRYPAETSRSDAGATHLIDNLEFVFKRGMANGKPAYRVVCEGIVVDEGLL